MPSILRGPTRLLTAVAMTASILFAPGCDDDDPVAPSVPTVLGIESGNNQTVVRSTVSAPMVVSLVDQYDDAMAGQAVTWEVSAGTGTLAAGVSTTDANGDATMTFTAGATPGPISIVARVTNVPNVVFTHTIQ